MKPKLILEYIKKYTSEMKELVLSVPEEQRILLPDHIVSNQEIDVYITKDAGVVIDYVGLNRRQKIAIHSSDRCFDELIFLPTEKPIPCNLGSVKLRPLPQTKDNEPTRTISIIGALNGITL